MQANGTAFDTPEQLLQRLGLLSLTQQSFSTFLAESLGGDTGSLRYAEEFVAAINRVNYNQGNGINALVGAFMWHTDSAVPCACQMSILVQRGPLHATGEHDQSCL